MRFYDLKGLSDKVASNFIAKCPKVKMKEVLDNPEILSKKILVFPGNYDEFDTNRLCARTFEYIQTENRWRVSDVIVYDMVITRFDYHFLMQELESEFEDFCNANGFVMDA